MATGCDRPPPGGYFVYLVDGDMPFFWVSFSPVFSRAGYQSKDVFLEQVVKKAHFLRAGYYFSNPRFGFYGFVNLSEFIQLSHGLCSNFLRTGYRFQGKILEQVKIFVVGTPLYKRVKYPSQRSPPNVG